MTENANHHNGESIAEESFEENVKQVYLEDLEMFDTSVFYLATFEGKVVGSVKVSLWDGLAALPIEKLFGINCANLKVLGNHAYLWHVGRLAISKDNPSGILLLRQLLTLAIFSICQHSNKGVMVAECDKKLLRILKLLGINTKALADGIEYLGSETIPIYSTAEWLKAFLTNNEQVAMIAKIPGVEDFAAIIGEEVFV